MALRLVDTVWKRRSRSPRPGSARPGRSGRSGRPGRAGRSARSPRPGPPGPAARGGRSSRPKAPLRPGRSSRPVAPGRCGRPSRPSRPARSAPWPDGAPARSRSRRPSPGARRGRVGSSSRRGRLPDASDTDTPGAGSRPDPMISMRAGLGLSAAAERAVAADVTTMPSMSNSASARRTSPTPAPVGTTVPSTVPRGSRAPAARHVQVPSSRLLVSSISILRAMAGDNATLAARRQWISLHGGTSWPVAVAWRPR